ncbi:hypothetical protein QMK19_27945 [Streptomyces sp. H10-C2]|uniref:hypothetical protein n=1 Tax=unclassified Streptomyces TaxID=2593676 RepID=UPI0024BA8B9C|nr:MULTISPECIES: hypothetical protein [unclassified Streptomyces]MDJ0343943.1 hypothetical protein [Streptomyces sp. PH10-H1]MDJ0373384.1 hypothetical protein [Streptomyces sp. H10-C2]
MRAHLEVRPHRCVRRHAGSGHTAVASDGRAAYSFDLTTGTRTPLDPELGVTECNGFTGRLVVGDVFPGPFAFADRVDTGEFTRLPALGGLNATATSADHQGEVVGSAATTPPDAPPPTAPTARSSGCRSPADARQRAPPAGTPGAGRAVEAGERTFRYRP